MNKEILQFIKIHLSNLLILFILGLFLLSITFIIMRLLRLRNIEQPDPFNYYLSKYTWRFNSFSIILIFLFLYFFSQLLFIFFPKFGLNFGEPFVMYSSFVLSILIGFKTEFYFFKKKHPNYILRKSEKFKITIHKYDFNIDNGPIYYSLGDEIPKYWDNLSHNFWKKSNKKIRIYFILILFPIFIFALFLVYVMITALIGNIIISSIILSVLTISSIIYFIIKFKTLLFLSKVRKWEYTSLSHPNIPINWMKKKFSDALLKAGYNYRLKTYKLMGDRYYYYYINDKDVCVRLLYSNSPIPNDYSICIGPDNSRDPDVIEELKDYLSYWSIKNIRPRIGYYKILDANIILLKDKTEIENYLKRLKKEGEHMRIQ